MAMALAAIVIGLVTRSTSAADYMYIGMDDNTIVRYDVSLATSALVQASGSVFVSSGQGLNTPYGLAFDKAGNLYAANGLSDTITRYDSSGNRIGTDFVPAGQGLSLPVGLAFDAAGNLYAANQSGNTITRYDSSGNRIGTDFVSGQGLNFPMGIAFDTAGNLYASNSSGNTITRYDPSGNRIGTDFVGVGQGLSGPAGLAFDSAGNLYAANFINSTIAKYNAAGFLQFVWNTPAKPDFMVLQTVVPEPSTYVLGTIATGLMAVIARRRKANRKG